MKKTVKIKKKSYTTQLPINLANRLEFLKKLKKGNINMSLEIQKVLYPMIESLEKQNGIDKDTYKQSKICEKCGSVLITRKGKKGDFLGCSTYPKCKNTISL